MASRVIVVTSVELGWDCIVEVYNADDIGREELEERYPSKRGRCGTLPTTSIE